MEPKAKEVLVELQKTHPDDMVTFSTCSTADDDKDVIKKCIVTADSKEQQEVTNISSVKE